MHVPAGHCRKCGYAMDPGRCPECGTLCTDVASMARTPWWVFGLAAGIGLIPLPWAYATFHIIEFFYRRMSAGLTADELALPHDWVSGCWQWTTLGYILVMPALIVTLTALLVWRERRCRPERGDRKEVLLLCLLTLLLGTVSWYAGVIWLRAAL